MVNLVSVAAVGENNVLGKDGSLPWNSIPEDKRQYKNMVDGHPLIYGSKTYSVEDGEHNGPVLVMSSDPNRKTYSNNHSIASSIDEALDWVSKRDKDVFVLGGGDIYELFFEVTDKMVISHIPGFYEGDVFFPEIDFEVWEPIEEKEFDSFVRITYVRK